ncbi:MAG: response regulator, partial [Candidatus Saccharibacteria bacterium]|nr:response regulator [Candidatus Saccharibacteria bacterium]
MTKILLVEDDKSLREIYSVRLLAEGYTMISSGDGEEALAAAIGERPDLIVSDVMMPKISGFEMLDLLRSNDVTKNIPVIMLTALSSEQQRERGESLGADRYLIKSQVGIEDIVRTVHEVLGDGDEQRNLSQIQDTLALTSSQPTTNAHETTISAQAKVNSDSSPIILPDQNTVDDIPAFDPEKMGASLSSNMSSPLDIQDKTTEQPASSDQPPAQSAQPVNPSTSPTPAAVQSEQPAVQTPAMPSTGNAFTPETYQSAFNPLAATNPAQAVGQPAIKMPDVPMSIPSREVVQPGSPSSYAAALQSAAKQLQQLTIQSMASTPDTKVNQPSVQLQQPQQIQQPSQPQQQGQQKQAQQQVQQPTAISQRPATANQQPQQQLQQPVAQPQQLQPVAINQQPQQVTTINQQQTVGA